MPRKVESTTQLTGLLQISEWDKRYMDLNGVLSRLRPHNKKEANRGWDGNAVWMRWDAVSSEIDRALTTAFPRSVVVSERMLVVGPLGGWCTHLHRPPLLSRQRGKKRRMRRRT